MRILFNCCVLVSVAIIVCKAQSCQEDGRYPVDGQCDAYIECKDGVAKEMLCPDGLLFNDKLGPQAYPCQYPIDVSCETRARLQSAQATEDCPHQFGYFRMGDASHCGQFINCVAGKAFIFDCPEGLAYNKDTYRCDWPDQVEDCDVESYLGFTCPPQPKDLGFQEYTFMPSPHDCHHYYVCIDGKPRLFNCGEHRGFNEITKECDGIENVTSCAQPTGRVNTQPISLTNNRNFRGSRF